MTPNEAGRLMKAARLALRRGELASRDITLLDCLMWSCRLPGRRQAVVSLRRLARLTGMCKQSVLDGLARLYETGLLRRYRQRQRIGWASRQASNRYEFVAPPAEFSAAATGPMPPPVVREQRPIVSELDLQTPLLRALDRLGIRIEAVEAGKPA